LTTLRSPNGDITLVPNSQGIERIEDDHPQSSPWWISYKDCIGDPVRSPGGDVFTFSLQSNVSGYNLEVWTGSDQCATGRNNPTTIGQCWLVGKVQLQTDNVNVEVPVRNVLARRVGATDLPGPLGEEVCDDSTEVNGEALSWYFIVVKNGQGSEYFVWDGYPGGTGFDVVGPSPPGRITVGIGESQLALEMDDVPTDATRQRYEAFCVPAGSTLDVSAETDAGAGSGGAASLLDAGLLDAGGASGAGGTGGAGGAGSRDAGAVFTCNQNVLQVGQRPPTDPQYSCGETNSISGTLRTKRLQNEVTYAVAVSGQDDLGNAGVISEIECGTPITLDDFYEKYSRAGGPGGGGFCSFEPQRTGAPASGAASLAVLMLTALGWRRSRGRA
jgi:hypothetical protein